MSETLELHLARELDVDYDAAAGALRAGPARWLPGFEQEGERITTRLALARAGRRVGRRAEVRVGSVQPFAYGVTARLEWQDARRPRLYPRLEGHLRLERGGEDGRCRFRFDARYTPPAGPLGESVDRAVMHRVADATVRDFFSGVAQRLEKSAASA
ncbi:MAG: hypothetical protein J2P43_00700 [Candidatus Dormibacteraeota bacterium]|nr:hypothetical protein [Candidatus Dormibacteraeota bacterium]MBO0743504.1 hypothetical protein [Candidatus Dormibacteraeota bacterium]